MLAKNLRLSDLARRGHNGGFELLSVRLPVQLLSRVDNLAQQMGSGKAEVVVALLNEGLDRYDRDRSPRGRQRSS